ncbi:hypothetical protein [Oceanivirga salmonicida]|uniref:hypothetical protein n=1 Tax=Oceanivirga salmonicida TaxID=1769291 RepID=UPI0012E300F0|nr:hypothetical protein [Oceanivirga salmonicida]
MKMKRDLTLMGLIILFILLIVIKIGVTNFKYKKELINILEKERGLIIESNKINVYVSTGFDVTFIDISMKDLYTNKKIEYRLINEIPNFKNDYDYSYFLDIMSYDPYLKNKDLMENKKEKKAKIEEILSKYEDKYKILYDIKEIYIYKGELMTRGGITIDLEDGIYYKTHGYINILAYLLNENFKGEKIRLEDINWEEMVKPITYPAIFIEVKSLDGSEVDKKIYKEIQKDLKEHYTDSYIIFSKKEWWELK